MFLRREAKLERVEQSEGRAWEETRPQRQRRPVGMLSQAREDSGFYSEWETLESFSREVPGSGILSQDYSGCYMENRTEETRVEGRRVRRLLGSSRDEMALPGAVRGGVDGF